MVFLGIDRFRPEPNLDDVEPDFLIAVQRAQERRELDCRTDSRDQLQRALEPYYMPWSPELHRRLVRYDVLRWKAPFMLLILKRFVAERPHLHGLVHCFLTNILPFAWPVNFGICKGTGKGKGKGQETLALSCWTTLTL